MARLIERSRELGVGSPASISTPYVNTIPAEQEPWFPGDDELERRIRAYIRWNAAVMVVRANKAADGIGGHLSTFASSAALYEVGFNHFFRGKEDGTPGRPRVHPGPRRAGHLRAGVPGAPAARGRPGPVPSRDRPAPSATAPSDGRGLSSYPHPRLMPDFWEYPTVSMGLGPILSIYQARFNRYLQNRRIDDACQQPGVVLRRRRRGRRARDPRRHLAGRRVSSSTTSPGS